MCKHIVNIYGHKQHQEIENKLNMTVSGPIYDVAPNYTISLHQ